MAEVNRACDILRRLDDKARTSYVPLMSLVAVHANLGDMDAAIALLLEPTKPRE